MLEDYLFFKSDATESLNEHGIILQDDFDLESNEITRIGDFYHSFELEISESDKSRLTEWIIKSANYKDNIPEMFDIRFGQEKIKLNNKLQLCAKTETKGFLAYTQHLTEPKHAKKYKVWT